MESYRPQRHRRRSQILEPPVASASDQSDFEQVEAPSRPPSVDASRSAHTRSSRPSFSRSGTVLRYPQPSSLAAASSDADETDLSWPPTEDDEGDQLAIHADVVLEDAMLSSEDEPMRPGAIAIPQATARMPAPPLSRSPETVLSRSGPLPRRVRGQRRLLSSSVVQSSPSRHRELVEADDSFLELLDGVRRLNAFKFSSSAPAVLSAADLAATIKPTVIVDSDDPKTTPSVSTGDLPSSMPESEKDERRPAAPDPDKTSWLGWLWNRIELPVWQIVAFGAVAGIALFSVHMARSS